MSALPPGPADPHPADPNRAGSTRAGSTRRADPRQARSFGRVADAYDRARPSYPEEAVRWLAGSTPARVLELGAGTGKLTEVLVGLGHHVVATDPSAPMLERLGARVPSADRLVGTAEQIPVGVRSVDLVVAAQAFHWFDHPRALPEIARVLRPGGVLAVVWNARDERVPWVRRLGTIIGEGGHESDPTGAIDDSGLYETVQHETFRFWQPLDLQRLRDLVTSRSQVATLGEADRDRVLAQVDDLYAEYGRGADGMLLPYRTSAYRTTVLPWSGPDPEPAPASGPAAVGPDDLGTDALLIDFR